MSIELIIPAVGESITEVQIGEWLKQPGDVVAVDEPIVVIETDKATVELPAPVSGTLTAIHLESGTMTEIGAVVGLMEEGAVAVADSSSSSKDASSETVSAADAKVMPAAARALAEQGLAADAVTATGPGGRLLKEDVAAHTAGAASTPPETAPAIQPESLTQQFRRVVTEAAPVPNSTSGSAREEEVIPLSPMRRRIAARLLEAQQTMAILTTFNEVDMSAVIALRKQYQDAFVKKYEIKIGFMSFFIKAVVDALKQFPQVNAEIRGHDIVYRNFVDIGVAVGSDKGLVVPVIRDTQQLSFAEIELTIADFGHRAKARKITLDELKGGTFTISNGGVYGSLLSTPIVNPPQSGILGLHAIQDRAVVVAGEIVVRPMMYVALSYDHRIVDGREAVSFLKRVKEAIEEPARMLIEV